MSGISVLRRAAVALSAVLLVSGCIHTPSASNLPPAPKNPPPELMAAPELPPYRIQVGDTLEVRMLLNPELNEEATVLPDGTVSTTVAQNVKAYNHTPAQLQETLEKLYQTQLKHPRVAVIVRSFAPTRVYVTGEVLSPGEFVTVGPNLTLLQAISRAGGLKNSAQPNDIVIIRRGMGDEPVAYRGNYREAASGMDASSDVRLAPYDVVFVPRSDIGNAYLYYQQYIQEFLPISFGLNYLMNEHTSVSNSTTNNTAR